MEPSRHGGLSRSDKGTGHWRWQRASALLSIPLSIWFVINFGQVVYSGYEQSLSWVTQPLTGCLLGLTLVSLLFHGHLGIVVIIDDYVRRPWRNGAILISGFITTLIGLSTIVAILVLLAK